MLSDAVLVAAAIAHQDWAWNALVDRYTVLVASVTRSFRLREADSAEVQQVVWMRLFESRERIRQPERVAGWIRTVTRNECLRTLRTYQQEVPTDNMSALDDGSEDDFDRGMIVTEGEAAIRHALVRLPRKGRALVEMQLERPDLTYEELAMTLDMPVGSIGPTRQRCLRSLRNVPEVARLAPS